MGPVEVMLLLHRYVDNRLDILIKFCTSLEHVEAIPSLQEVGCIAYGAAA